MPLRLKKFKPQTERTREEMLEYLTISVEEVFGYSSLPNSIAISLGIDPMTLSKEKGWELHSGSMNHIFSRAKVGVGTMSVVKFGGDKPKKPKKPTTSK